jgi:aldose sugar dehydrogenase
MSNGLRRFVTGSVVAAGMLVAGLGWAQQKIELRGGSPIPAKGFAAPLGPGPFDFRTAEDMDIRVSVFVSGVDHPYSMAFLPNGDLLFTEHAGRLRIVRNGALDPQPITGGPTPRFGGRGAQHGYMSVVPHPQFASNKLVYLSYTKPIGSDAATPAIARGRLEGNALVDLKDIFVVDGVTGAIGMALVFGQDGKLYASVGAPDSAQDPASLGGKVVRLNDDGSVPKDNPLVGKTGVRPEIFTLGHRNVIGMAVHPGTGKIWISEMGPNGGDELNVLEPGRNYGWPTVSFGRTYPGPWQSKTNTPTHEGFESPRVIWIPSISVTGIAFYTADKLPKWKGDLLVGGLRYGEIPGTGRVDRILFNEQMEELRRESLLGDLRQRVRDVKQGPDGLLYVATDETQGAILRIAPRP